MSLRLALAVQFSSWRLRLRHSRGATAVEYGLMCALIFVFIIGMVSAVGTELNRVLVDLKSSMTAWAQT